MKVAQKHVNNDANRSATEASQSRWQNQSAQVTDNRKETVSQRALVDGINDSPRMLAQRRQIEGYMGSGQQPATVNAYSNHSAPTIQAKLTIGQPADKYEQEADRVAAQVVKQINFPASAKSPQGQSAQREAMPEETLQTKPVLQHREAIGGAVASADLESAINSSKGGGQALDAGLQQSMEQAMGVNFSGVRVHTDFQSDQLNRSIQAKAFTTGQDVFFRQGTYQPSSREGQQLIAHELTHVVQQEGRAVQRSHLTNLQPLPLPARNGENTIQRYTVKYGKKIDENGKKIKTDLITPTDPKLKSGTPVSAWPTWWPTGPAETANDFVRENFIQGHLLNQKLGGDGSDRRNLTPLTRSANSMMSSTMENEAKDWLKYNFAIEYWVEADYNKHPSVNEVGAGHLSPTEEQTLQNNYLDKMCHQVGAQITVWEPDPLGGWKKSKKQPKDMYVKNEGTALKGSYV